MNRPSRRAVESPEPAASHAEPSEHRSADTVGELDIARRMLESIRQGEDLRRFKIERLRVAINGEHYENDLKLSIAVDRLLEKVLVEPVGPGH